MDILVYLATCMVDFYGNMVNVSKYISPMDPMFMEGGFVYIYNYIVSGQIESRPKTRVLGPQKVALWKGNPLYFREI